MCKKFDSIFLFMPKLSLCWIIQNLIIDFLVISCYFLFQVCAQENMRVGEGGAFNKTSKHSLVIDNFLFITWTENEAPLKSTAEIIFFFL